MKKVLPILLCVATAYFAKAQSVGIGTTTPNGSSILDLSSSSRGFLPPRMATSQRLAITNPVAGLMVYDTTTDTYWFFENGKWNELVSSNKLALQIPTNRIDPGGDAGDNFGFSVSLGGTGSSGYVGAPMLSNGGTGACYRISYTDNNLWTISSVNPAGLAAGDAYGYAVSMDRVNGSTDGIISAPFDDSSTVTSMGSVYFFNSVSFLNKMYAPAGSRITGALFGLSVDMSSKTSSDKGYAIVGAPGANSNRGAAFIYQFNPNTNVWDFEATLTDINGAAGDSMGTAVSLYYDVTGDTAWAFVGSPYDDENSVTDIGSVIVFRKAAGSAVWTRVAKLVPSQAADMHFGASISNVMRCGQVLIGAPFRNGSIGQVYAASLTALGGSTATFAVAALPGMSGGSAGNGSPGIGYRVSAMAESTISCDIYALAGSFSGLIASNSGASFGVAGLYKFSNGSWSFVEKLTDPEVETTGYGFGRAVSLHTGQKVMTIGAPNQTIEGMANRGKVQFRKLQF